MTKQITAETTKEEMQATFNALPDMVKLGLLYKHNEGFRQAISDAVWQMTQRVMR